MTVFRRAWPVRREPQAAVFAARLEAYWGRTEPVNSPSFDIWRFLQEQEMAVQTSQNQPVQIRERPKPARKPKGGK